MSLLCRLNYCTTPIFFPYSAIKTFVEASSVFTTGMWIVYMHALLDSFMGHFLFYASLNGIFGKIPILFFCIALKLWKSKWWHNTTNYVHNMHTYVHTYIHSYSSSASVTTLLTWITSHYVFLFSSISLVVPQQSKKTVTFPDWERQL